MSSSDLASSDLASSDLASSDLASSDLASASHEAPPAGGAGASAGIARGPLAAMVAAVLAWSTAFVVSSDALVTTSPAVVTTLRFAIAALVLVPVAAWRDGRAVRAMLASRSGAILGLTGIAATHALQTFGLTYTSAGTVALLQALLPVATAVLAAVVLRERMGPAVLAGLVLSTVGVAMVASGGASLDLGAVIVMVGVVSYAPYTVGLRRLAGRGGAGADPIAVAAASASWGVAFLLPWLAWEAAAGDARWPVTPGAVGDVLYLGLVVSAGALVLWSYGAGQVRSSVAGVLTAALPACGYAVSVLLGEPVSWVKVAGGVLAVAGVAVATLAPARGDRGSLGVDQL